MMHSMTRRKLLTRAGALGAAGAVPLPWVSVARAAETLNAVQWGGPWIEGAKAVAAKQSKFDIKWELHAGPAAAIMSKIKAAWPNPLYDFVAQSDPHYYTWMREGWAEPLTFEEMPNLRDVPAVLRNDKGEIINVPMSTNGVFWGYRSDRAPFEIKKYEDLLDPRLKGQLAVRDVLQGQNNMVALFAKALGGDERNMEPGWKFMTELAKSGNIGRVGKSEVDFINSLTSGECSVGFWSMASWGKVSESAKCVFLNRVPGQKMFRTGLLTEAFLIPNNSPRKKEAKEFLNYFVSPEGNTLYNQHVSLAPTNTKSSASELAENIVFKTPVEREEFSITFDAGYLSTQQDAMNKKWEQEIAPHIR
jgi:putative spermidine/putrescine transport system substrate-binding protein